MSAWSALSWVQIGFWRDGETLCTRAVRVTESNWLAWNALSNLAFTCALKGDRPGFEAATQRLRAVDPGLEADVHAQLRGVR